MKYPAWRKEKEQVEVYRAKIWERLRKAVAAAPDDPVVQLLWKALAIEDKLVSRNMKKVQRIIASTDAGRPPADADLKACMEEGSEAFDRWRRFAEALARHTKIVKI